MEIKIKMKIQLKKEFKRPIASICIIILCMCVLTALCLYSGSPVCQVYALDDDEFSGYKADNLTINVGYFGGPYYQKKVFTEAQLRALGTVKADYTLIDNMPDVVIDHVEGVRLVDIMEAAGIDINSVQSFNFWSNDKKDGYYTSLTKTELIDTPRYCYYSLPENWDEDAQSGNAHAGDIKERVDTLMALGDNWNRYNKGAGAEFGSDYLNLNTNTRYRLIFGQTNTYTHTAQSSAKWVHSINVTLGGAPTLTLEESSLEGKVGSVLRTAASVKAADSAISESAKITWSSSDESVAKVDENGNVTITGEGSAVITATFGGASAQLVVNGSGDDEKKDGPASGGRHLSSDSSQTGEITSPIPAKTVSSSDIGGVQNWRVYEMSSDAAPLAQQEEENPMLPVMGAGGAAIFAAGITGRAVKFRRDIGRIRQRGTGKGKKLQ